MSWYFTIFKLKSLDRRGRCIVLISCIFFSSSSSSSLYSLHLNNNRPCGTHNKRRTHRRGPTNSLLIIIPHLTSRLCQLSIVNCQLVRIISSIYDQSVQQCLKRTVGHLRYTTRSKPPFFFTIKFVFGLYSFSFVCIFVSK